MNLIEEKKTKILWNQIISLLIKYKKKQNTVHPISSCFYRIVLVKIVKINLLFADDTILYVASNSSSEMTKILKDKYVYVYNRRYNKYTLILRCLRIEKTARLWINKSGQ